MKNILQALVFKRYILILIGFILVINYTVIAQKKTPIPIETEKVLIEKIIRRAFLTEKDLPDYAYISDKKEVIFSTERPCLSLPDKPYGTLTKEQLPCLEELKLILKTPKQIKRISRKGNLLYARLNQVDVYSEETAIIELELKWALSKRNIKRGLVSKSSSGYSILYKKVNGKWDDGKLLRTWIN